MMDTTRFIGLLERYENSAATPAEEQELLAIFSDPANDKAIENFLVGELATTPLDAVADPFRWQPVIDRILGKEKAFGSSGLNALRPVRTAWRIQIGRAAAILILLLGLGGGYLWWNHTNPAIVKTNQPQPSKTDIAPGGNRAILTLAGGQTIILDSTAKGQLALQGGTRVSKTDSGKLTYQVVDKTKRTATVYNTLSTPRGGQFQLTLPDGTRVWLNAASSITYPTAFIEKERTVTITGEAYLEIAQNARQPFIAKVGKMDILVLGTSFNVNAYADEADINTTLFDGKVQIKQEGLAATLVPGQQAVVSNQRGAIRVDPHADLVQALAWKNGLFAFADADLPTVMRQLSRWYNIEVRYEGKVPSLQFNGKIGRSLNLSQVLDILASSNVHYTIEPGNKLTIRP